MSDTKAKNPPVAKIRVGSVTASIWENKGEKGTNYSVTFDRRYRDGKGNWHSSDTYFQDDLLFKAKASHLAYDRIAALQAVGE